MQSFNCGNSSELYNMSDMLAGNICFNLFNIPVVYWQFFGHEFSTLDYHLSSSLNN